MSSGRFLRIAPWYARNRDEPWPPTGPPDGSKSATDGPVQMQIECTPSWSIAANDRLGLNFLVLGRAGKVRYRRILLVAVRPGEGSFSVGLRTLRHPALPTVIC